MRNSVETYKRKFDGSPKAPPWDGDLVDAVGERWLVVYYEAPPWETGDPPVPVAHAVQYFGLDCPLTVIVAFDAAGQVVEFHCDAALPATIDGREIAYVDLDLDLIVRPGKEPFERDHEQFVERSISMRYSQEAIVSAHAGLRLARELYDAGACPFDGHPGRTLGMVLASRGPV